ncbi:MAG: riboflavin synthase [Rhodospirillaceae bacterium]|nr:riboflavin synthase [Rhodospirillaceae bacterium]
MFTGIITDIGRVQAIVPAALAPSGLTRFTLATAYDTGTIALGASIACSGPCLSVVDKGPGWFAVDASAETLARTTLGGWAVGTRVNLERALRAGDELGGHLVTGHVDGVARVVARRPEGGSLRLSVEAPAELARFVASKGSVALDGVSLTVNEVEGAVFGVNLIPVTRERTTLGEAQPGTRLNMEIDLLARYVARLMERGGA